jgi:hypothetical protein
MLAAGHAAAAADLQQQQRRLFTPINLPATPTDRALLQFSLMLHPSIQAAAASIRKIERKKRRRRLVKSRRFSLVPKVSEKNLGGNEMDRQVKRTRQLRKRGDSHFRTPISDFFFQLVFLFVWPAEGAVGSRCFQHHFEHTH